MSFPTHPQTVAVIGTGTIGASWATLFLGAGLTVRASDPGEGAESKLRAFVTAAWPSLETLGQTSGRSAEQALAALSFFATPEEAATGAELVQENAPERIEIKRETYAKLESALAPDVVIASSTSGIMPSELQAGMTHPERLVVGHPFNPPHLVPLVEVVPGKLTSDAAVEAAMAFYTSVGKVPIKLNREVIGHIANRLQAAVLRECVYLAREGVASMQDIDLAASMGPGQRWAFIGQGKIFALAGGVGGMAHFLDHLGEAVETWWDDLGDARLDTETRAMLTEAYGTPTEESFARDVAFRDAALLRRLKALSEDAEN